MSGREKRDDQKDQHDQRDRQEELNPFSVRFDPLAALYSRNVTIPVVNAPTLDNISKFVAGTSGVQIKPTKTAQVKAEPLPVTVTPQQKSIDGWDNVVTRMKKVEGPLAVLRDCMEKKVKIKVYTRDMCGIRGHLTGFVVAFDKMWNLAMEDVTEVWRRRRKKKIPATGLVS
ncbi:U7 snRNA-associated Sm-like protein LSm11 isoform X2 [Cimex lectularius]|uniref:LSM domain-containing protein n=1 Tax=Cimex lectularius TaxID=79782 RepID=A0A8I6SLV1_CIMLE|nr:U7 snRNA-associated Sm-like protein LSm11 isoform X2 [Cimex lectularius]